MGSQRNCTWILGLAGFRVVTTESDGEAVDSRVTIRIERRGSRGYGCSGCGRRTRRVRSARDRTWDDLPWASHPVTLIYAQRRVRCRQCGIRTEAIAFADAKARVTRRLRQQIGLAGQRVAIRVPRIRHVAGSELPLRSYEALHGDRAVNDVLLKRVLYGISCRNYEAAAEAIPGAIGLSGSTVSRGFIQASGAQLREFQERDLAGEDVVAIVLDGKTFADATLVIALGITLSGEKRFLGFVETDTENAQVLRRSCGRWSSGASTSRRACW